MAAAAMKIVASSSGASYVGSRSGQTYRLGAEIGQGGNGIVYTVTRRPDLVAKIQKFPLGSHDVAKLERMMQGATVELLSVSAWPVDGLKDAAGRIAGFVMPRIADARPVYELYGPRSRVQHFPSADFRFIVHVAANIARLFQAIHEAGFVAGDVNHSNVMVRQNGTAAVIDCDSMQVGDGSQFRCAVATELFVPPELFGADLASTPRTPNHDNFGLAVLIFHLLFMGRHPYAGVFHGRGEMPIERAIAEGRYAYSHDSRRTQMTPPPMTVPMSAIGPEVARLFEEAFHPNARAGTRPRPLHWIAALDALKASLVPCRLVGWHHHPADHECPWCRIEGASRLKLFGGIVKVVTAGVADLETLWARYQALTSPAFLKRPPRPALVLPRPSLPRLRAVRWRWPSLALPRAGAVRRAVTDGVGRVRWSLFLYVPALIFALYDLKVLGSWQSHWAQLVALGQWFAAQPIHVQALAGFGALAAASLLEIPLSRLLLHPRPTGLARLRVLPALKAKAPAQASRPTASNPLAHMWADITAWRGAMRLWWRFPAAPDVTDLAGPIAAVKTKLDALAVERDNRIRACAAPMPEDEQRVRYLAQYRIEDARLHNIGAARCAVLRSWGIDTAADVDVVKISAIPGFGKNLTDKLLLWRENHEKGFTPSTAVVIDPLEVQKIDRDLASRRTRLMKELREYILEMERRFAPVVQAREAILASTMTRRTS